MLSKQKSILAFVPPLVLMLILGTGLLMSCSENPPTGGKASCDTCKVPCDTCDTTLPCDTCDTTTHPCDTCNIDKDSAAHAFLWTQYTIPNENNLTGCWVFGENNIFVMGSRLYQYKGNSWNRFPLKIEGGSREALLTDGTMFALSESDMWFINGVIYHYFNGNVVEYRSISDTTFQGVIACWGTSSNDMFFVGVKGNISHFDGTTFTKMTSPTAKNLRSVWGTSHNDVWVCGTNYSTGEVVLLHYDGTLWKEIDLNIIGSFGCAGCESVASVWAVESSGAKNSYVGGGHFHHKKNSSSWITDSAHYVGNKLLDGSQISLSFIRGNSPVDLMCASDWGFVSHWNGKSWKRYNELFNEGSSSYYTGGFSFTKNTACIVGSKNGTSWIAIGRRKPF